MVYFVKDGEEKLIAAFNLRECKLSYVYDDYSENKRRVSKKSNPVFVECKTYEEAKVLMHDKQLELLKNDLEEVAKCLRWELENDPDIIGFSITQWRTPTILMKGYHFRDTLRIGNPYSKTSSLAKWSYPYTEDHERFNVYKEMITNLSKEFNKNFCIEVKFDSIKFLINIPPKEHIRLKDRFTLVLTEGNYDSPEREIKIIDKQMWTINWKSTILFSEFMKLGIRYGTLMKSQNLQRTELDNYYVHAILIKNGSSKTTEDDTEAVVIHSGGKTNDMNNLTSIMAKTFAYAPLIRNGIKNADFHIILPSCEMHFTEDYLLGCLTIKNKQLIANPNMACNSDFNYHSNSWRRFEGTSEYIIKEIKRQADPDLWKSFLLLSEVTDVYDD